MRRFPLFLLVASLAVFALPSFGTAQAPRGRSPALPAPLQLANRALIEGKYDEIDALTEKLLSDAKSGTGPHSAPLYAGYAKAFNSR